MAAVTLEQLVLRWETAKADFNGRWLPVIRELQIEVGNGATNTAIRDRYVAAFNATVDVGKEIENIKTSANEIFNNFGVPDFIAKVDGTMQAIINLQTILNNVASRSRQNELAQNSKISTTSSQAASGGTASTASTQNAASAASPDNADAASGGQATPGIPIADNTTTVAAIPGSAAAIASGTSGLIASPGANNTTAGSPQTSGSNDDSGPTLSQNIKSSAISASDIKNLAGGALPNPLEKYPTYTYNLSLYLCTPSQYNSFATAADGPTLNLPGSQLIARSGGSPIGQDQRNIFFSDVDMVVDNLRMENIIGFSNSGIPTSGGRLNFTITEPAGATFLYRLQSAVSDIYNKDPSVGKTFYGNSTFALVVRFYGYDNAGSPIVARTVNQIDAAGSSESSLLTKIIFFIISSVKTRIGNRIVEYQIEGVFAPQQIAKTAILGVVPARFELTGTNLNDIFNGQGSTNNTAGQDSNPRAESTDAEAQDGGFYGSKASAQPSQNIPTRGLAQALNDEFNRLSRPNGQGNKVIEFADEYEIKFASEALKNAKITISDIDNSLKSAAGVRPTDTKAENTRKNTSIAKNAKNVTVLPGTPIIQWLDMMIRNSDYIKKQASALVSESTADNTDADIQGDEDFYGNKLNQPKSPIKWYKITPYIQIKQYDNLRKTYAHKITYVIGDYDIVDAKSPYFKRAPWPGPDKLYLYSFTGQNTSVLNYEQDFNWLYRQTFSVNAPMGQDNAKQAAQSAGLIDSSYAFRVVAETGKQGSLGDSTDLSARAAAGIYSPTDLATIKLKILGDPDYIFQDWYNINQALVTRAEYKRSLAAGSTGLSTNFGELYLQMTFLTGDDWDQNLGIMKVEPRSGYVRKVSNAYRINKITSTFQNGRFEQDVEGTLLVGVDPDKEIVKGDFVSSKGSAAVPEVNTDSTDTDSASARQDYNDQVQPQYDATANDSGDVRTQPGGFSSVPQTPTGAVPDTPQSITSPLAARYQELGVQRDLFRRRLLPNETQTGNDDSPPDTYATSQGE